MYSRKQRFLNTCLNQEFTQLSKNSGQIMQSNYAQFALEWYASSRNGPVKCHYQSETQLRLTPQYFQTILNLDMILFIHM